VELCRDLASEGWYLIFIGSKAERELCDRIIIRTGIEAANCCGDFSITASAALLSQCNALICNDSGALHIGNAVKIPVFAFFGPTVKRFGYFPFGENDTLFEVDLNCRPCGMHGHEKCPLGHHNCMRMLKPDQILPVILRTIRKTSP
jgi:heptosyltransferase-2